MGEIYLGLVDTDEPPIGYKKYIWMSDGCTKAIRWCRGAGVEYEVLPPIWNDEESVYAAIKYLKLVRNKLIDSIMNELNDYNGTKYEKKEFFILLASWLMVFLTAYYDKYKHLEQIKRIKKTVEISIYDRVDIDPFLDFYDYFHASMMSDEFNLIQYTNMINYQSDCINNADIKRIRNLYKHDSPKNSQNRDDITRRLLRRIVTHYTNGARAKLAIGYDAGFALAKDVIIDMIIKNHLGVSTTSSAYFIQKNTFSTVDIDVAWRMNPVDTKDTYDEFYGIMAKLIKKEIPYIYLEKHRDVIKYIKKEYKHYSDTRVLVSGSSACTYDEINKALLALVHSNGGMLCGVQHGGNYGVEKNWMHDDEYDIYDRYYTWGWKAHNDAGKFFDMPSRFFMRYDKYNKTENDKILYVTYAGSKYLSRFDRINIRYKDLIKDGEIAFIKNLPREIRDNTIVRLFPEDYGWHAREDIKNEIEDVIFDDNKNIRASISEVSLIITSDWQNVFMEAIYGNKPVIALCDGSYITSEAKADYELLKNVGVIQSGWEEVGILVQKIYGRVWQWWNESERKKAIDKIRRKYAWVPDDARDIWLNELSEIAEGTYNG